MLLIGSGNAEQIAKGFHASISIGDLKMAAQKTVVVNYTAEQTAQVVAEYQAGVSVEQIAETLGKTARSIIAKLSREGVYQAKQYKSKTGEKVEKKDETADAIGAVLKMTEPEIESLTKANKTALRKIWQALAMSKPLDE